MGTGILFSPKKIDRKSISIPSAVHVSELEIAAINKKDFT